MRPSELCKQAGLKSLAELADITRESVQTLNNWYKNKPVLFATVLDGALVKKGFFVRVNIPRGEEAI